LQEFSRAAFFLIVAQEIVGELLAGHGHHRKYSASIPPVATETKGARIRIRVWIWSGVILTSEMSG
jgi:hypothetical protein